MCGIAGILSKVQEPVHQHYLEEMAQSLAHRGPDGQGVWINEETTVGFAHRRLAIIDLSAAASQPMHYGSYTIVYNGEIYNYPEIKAGLQKKGYQFKTQSDTEVIMAAYDCYRDTCLELFDGMFAFAIWDAQEQQLFLARDRFGEKPLFYHYDKKKHCLYFASEMKALWAAGVTKEADNQMLYYYLNTGLSRTQHHKGRTFYNNILSLPPAHYLLYSPKQETLTTKRYWQIKQKEIAASVDQAVETFGNLFQTAVQYRLRSDTATATNLSGGLDSASIAATIQSLIPQQCKYKSFSVIFPGFEKDESTYIKQISNTLKLENYTITPSAASLATQLQELCYYQEEPFSSSSIFIQYALGALAQSHGIKVLLDGQGADEVLGGYNKYLHWHLQELFAKGQWPRFLREKTLLQQQQPPLQWSYKNYIAALSPGFTSKALVRKQKENFLQNQEITNDFAVTHYDDALFYKPRIKTLNDILRYNTMQSGLEDLLRFADRNTMAHGVELRLPFLSHTLVEYCFSLSGRFKINDGYTKWILRTTMKEKLPAAIVWRKDKIGFEPPQLQWMKEPLVQELVHQSRKKLATAGILKKNMVNIPVRPAAAYEAQNTDWWYLIAGMFL